MILLYIYELTCIWFFIMNVLESICNILINLKIVTINYSFITCPLKICITIDFNFSSHYCKIIDSIWSKKSPEISSRLNINSTNDLVIWTCCCIDRQTSGGCTIWTKIIHTFMHLFNYIRSFWWQITISSDTRLFRNSIWRGCTLWMHLINTFLNL